MKDMKKKDKEKICIRNILIISEILIIASSLINGRDFQDSVPDP